MRDIRRLGLDDLDGLCDLSGSRSWGRTAQKWTVTLATSDAWGIDDGDGRLVASITLARYDGVPDALGGMLVRADHERQGIATALVEHLLAEVGDAPVLLYATTYGEPLYRRLGFVERERVVRHAGPGLARRPPASVDVGPPTDAALDQIARLDAIAFGADRSRLIQAIAAQPGALAAVHREGRAAGIAWHWDDQRAVGPISAATPGRAAEVVAALAAGPEQVRLDLHESQAELGAWCTAQGLPAVYQAPAMVRPATGGMVPGPAEVTYRALASQGFG